jgi:hypothetical protein
MTMTREDVLRELELLPVWTLHPSFKAAQALFSSTDTHPAEALAVTYSRSYISSDSGYDYRANS